MIKIAASDSSAADKAAANVICGATNSQNDINTAMNADNLSLYFFNGNYSIDAPVNIRSGCVLHGDSTDGVLFNCNNTTAVLRTSAPATVHEQVRVESMSVQAGSHDDLGCDFRGFIRSHFDELKIAGFTTGVWFGGDLPTYASCWSNQLSRFEIANNLVGVKLSGTNSSGVSTANNTLLTEGEIICRDATGGKAIDAIDAEFVVDHCDIGYGNASAGIVIGQNANNTRIVNSRFEWDAQSSSLYPISIAAGSYYHYIVGNIYTDGCTKPNLYDANLPGGRYIQIDDFQRSAAYPDGFIDINCDTYFRRSPTFPGGVFVQGDMNSAFAAVTAGNVDVFGVNTNLKLLSMVNGGKIQLCSDDFSTVSMYLDGSNGRLTLTNGELISSGTPPTASAGTAAGSGASASIYGHNMAGTVALTTGTSPSTGKIIDIAWSTARQSSSYSLVLTPANSVAANAHIYVDLTVQSQTHASIRAATALTASTAYNFNYVVISC